MSFKWSENEFAYLNDDNQTLASIGFKMINDNKTYVVERTWVDEKARGQGLAKKITVEFLQNVRQENKTVLPLCSYTQKYFAKHPGGEKWIKTNLKALSAKNRLNGSKTA